MELTLLLPWFPILLAVGVGGRLLGRTRGLFLGVVCALFWIVLTQASAGYSIWQELWTVIAMAAGAVAIAVMGAWAGESTCHLTAGRAAVPSETSSTDEGFDSLSRESDATLTQLHVAMEQFDDWLEQHRDDEDPWSPFDEFIRSVARQCCRATHVRPYRLLSEGEELAPLRSSDELDRSERISARRGIIGHVVTTGRSYVAGDRAQGELVAQLASGSDETIAWAFAIRRGPKRLGVITVDHLDVSPDRNGHLLRAMERLVNQFWLMLDEAIRSRTAVQDDPVSGLPTRPAFLRIAGHSLEQSYRQGEPVAVVVIALEGLRELGDSGRWEVADELIWEFSQILRKKIRLDDRLGRFDDSRFVLLLRRVDTELATLIVSQLILRLASLCDDKDRWRAAVAVRFGLAGSGTARPDLNTLVFRALSQSKRARREQSNLASDLGQSEELVGERA